MDKRQTLLEKLVSLVRFSHQGTAGLTSKIRHFYDIHYLLQDEDCREFLESDNFISQFTTILEHDKIMFDTPVGWQNIPLNEIPLFTETERVWEKISGVYKSELSALAFKKIPSSEDIVKSFKLLVYYVQN